MKTRIHSRRAFLVSVALGGGALIVSRHAAYAESLTNTGANGVAISGYDPVAYFTQNAAVQGSAEHTVTIDGVVYQFASAENRSLFAADPARYVPAYGGFCAYAVARGYTAKIDPEAFSVVDNRLFLNFSKDVRGLWEKDVPGNVTRADANWPGLSSQ